MRSFNSLFHLVAGITLAASLGLAGCGEARPPAPVTQEVGVVTVQPRPVALTTELPGRVSPVRIAELRARVDGIVLKRAFTEGSDVCAGQLLYQIDPAPYQAAYDSAKATLTKAEANLTSSALLARRYTALVAEHAVSKQEYDDAVAAQQQARADVAAARAALETARLNLGYTRVVAPIAGRIGKSLVTEGAYVRQSDATPLATIQQLDPIYVDVTQASTELLRLRRQIAAGQLRDTRQQGADVSLTLEDGSPYAESGTLRFSDVTVDTGTGTFTVRAEFPNPQLALLPGMFVHARIKEGVDETAILVPQQGVTHDSRGEPTALVVDAEQKVALRQLQINRALGNQWLVTSGLDAGDRLIVEGLQKVRPGMAVKAVAVPTTDDDAATPDTLNAQRFSAIRQM